MITAVVGFNENGLRCAEELEHSCKDHSSKQAAEKIHTALLQTGPAELKLQGNDFFFCTFVN